MRRASGTHFAFAQMGSFLIVALFFGGVTAAQDAPGDKGQKKKRPFAERVNDAIDRGAAWLKARQLKDGSWGPCVASGSYSDPTSGLSRPCHETGPTSFSLFTLAMCGMNKKDPVAKSGLKWLARHGRAGRKTTSYESSSIVLMLCAFNGPERIVPVTKNPVTRPRGSRFSKREWRFMHTHVLALIGPENSCVRESGGFGYWPRRRRVYADVSASQFALLALRSAVRAGYPVERVKPGVWSRAAKYIADLQQPNGGVPYHEGKAVSPGITAGGLASLILCHEQIAGGGAKPPTWLDESMKHARARLDEVFNVAGDGRRHYHYCHLYAIERAGMLSGKKVLGGMDWYRHGAEWLLSEQRGDLWVDRACTLPKDVLGTCFALLFLKRATIPAITPSDD